MAAEAARHTAFCKKAVDGSRNSQAATMGWQVPASCRMNWRDLARPAACAVAYALPLCSSGQFAAVRSRIARAPSCNAKARTGLALQSREGTKAGAAARVSWPGLRLASPGWPFGLRDFPVRVIATHEVAAGHDKRHRDHGEDPGSGQNRQREEPAGSQEKRNCPSEIGGNNGDD